MFREPFATRAEKDRFAAHRHVLMLTDLTSKEIQRMNSLNTN